MFESEDELQESIIEWAEYLCKKYPELELLYHTPNGGKRSKSEAARFKRMGVKAGVPDLCLPVARGEHHGLYIELKVGENTPSPDQKKWLKKLKQQGYYTSVCRCFDEATGLIIAYLKK